MKVAVIAYRLVLAIAAFTGVGYAVAPNGLDALDFAFWSQLSALAVGLVAVAGIVVELRPSTGSAGGGRWLVWLRGASTSWTLVTLAVFALLLGADYSSPASALEHLVVPVLAVIEWAWLGSRGRLPWFAPLLWLVVPLLYLPVYVVASASAGPLYPFLRPGEPGFGTWVAILMVVFTASGYVVWLRSLLGRNIPALADVVPSDG